ncbi:DUF3422 family protein [Sphingomonas crocodyli]|uniref:DUF3422 family protein n=1 Tax=Sphingomonas crocodyli TaxID=1979270 RepID=A0A437M5L8_9SPHN|nr:DUF3422 domain-containing protein [Sphingomonas crocodyli]RVT92962.1 DUF3422 family protein [Sphingomonas crocodyli]
MMSLLCHPDRSRALAELHARPFSAVETPHRVLHFAFQTSASQADRDRDRIEQLAGGSQPAGWLGDRRHLALGAQKLLWERHGEFISYTIAVPLEQKACWPDHLAAPGPLLVAVDLRLVPEGLRPAAMVQASIADGQALIATDFAENADGFVDIAIVNRSMSPEVAGATVQRVLEIETYRCFALLGLPVAEQAALVMGMIEHDLPSVMEKMDAASNLEDNQELLDRLTSMTLDLERSSASTHFRFGATKAYAELVRLRLGALLERPDLGGPGLASFFSRRFEPAIRTCATISHREAILARKLTRAAQLLRTRVEITLESQNRDLLETMGDRVRLQLRLQQTVEGLSVAAIAYYVTSLFHLLVTGLQPVRQMIEPELLTSLATLPIIAVVALAVRHIRRHHIQAEQR